jgi:hypothetical protein
LRFNPIQKAMKAAIFTLFFPRKMLKENVPWKIRSTFSAVYLFLD